MAKSQHICNIDKNICIIEWIAKISFFLLFFFFNLIFKFFFFRNLKKKFIFSYLFSTLSAESALDALAFFAKTFFARSFALRIPPFWLERLAPPWPCLRLLRLLFGPDLRLPIYFFLFFFFEKKKIWPKKWTRVESREEFCWLEKKIMFFVKIILHLKIIDLYAFGCVWSIRLKYIVAIGLLF